MTPVDALEKTVRAAAEAHKPEVKTGRIYRTELNAPVNLNSPVNLVAWAQKITKTNIEIVVPDVSDSQFDAICWILEKKSIIAVMPHNNYCHQRFYAAKELIHLITYEAGASYIVDSVLGVKKLLKELLAKDKLLDQNSPAVMMDKLAFIGAVELLMPTCKVELFRQLRDQAEQKLQGDIESGRIESANLEVAKFLGVPEFVVEMRLDGDIGKALDDLLK